MKYIIYGILLFFVIQAVRLIAWHFSQPPDNPDILTRIRKNK